MFKEAGEFPTIEKRFTIIKKLGKGGQGTCYSAKNKKTGEERALKIIDLEGMSLSNQSSAIKEALVLTSVKHKNVIEIFEWEKAAESNNLLLVLEYCPGGDLSKFMMDRAKSNNPSFSNEEILKIMRQICEGMRYCHKLTPPVIHRDLKPGNILIDGNGDIKLADFGLATQMKVQV